MAHKKERISVQPAAPVAQSDQLYARTVTRLMIASAVWSLWEKVKRDRGFDQQWLAERLGKDKSRVSRLLTGPGNWTLNTVADLLEAMEGRLVTVEAKSYLEIAACSTVQPTLKVLRETGRFWNVIYVAYEVMPDPPNPSRSSDIPEEGFRMVPKQHLVPMKTITLRKVTLEREDT